MIKYCNVYLGNTFITTVTTNSNQANDQKQFTVSIDLLSIQTPFFHTFIQDNVDLYAGDVKQYSKWKISTFLASNFSADY